MTNTPKAAFITGVNGQDGIYMTELLLSKGYIVHGLVRPCARGLPSILETVLESDCFHLHHGDVLDSVCLQGILRGHRIDEIYHFAAQSHVPTSFVMPLYTSEVIAMGTLTLIQVIRMLGLQKTVKFYNACTSEVFGDSSEPYQDENTLFRPLSPYAVAKAFAFHAVRNWRSSEDVFAVNGILFNHESPCRGQHFVSRKISIGVALIVARRASSLVLGNLEAKRDWGHASDYVRGIHTMLQYEEPQDFVLASGESRTIREFVNEAFSVVDIRIVWRGAGFEEVGVDAGTAEVRVKLDRTLCRPLEVPFLKGRAAKAEKLLKWKPLVSFKQLVSEMVLTDLALAKTGAYDKKAFILKSVL